MALLWALLPSIGFALGFGFARTMNRTRSEPSRSERKELEQLRDLISDVTVVLAEGSVLGDHSAVKALDLINNSRRRA